MHGAAVGVVGGVRNELIVGGQCEPFVQRIGIICFQHAFAAVIELAVADEHAEAAGGDEVAMIPRQGVDRAAETDYVVWPPPARALDRGAERQAGIDVGERHDFGLAVVPAPAAEQPHVVGDGLLEIDRIAILDAAGAGLRDVEVESGIVQRVAIAAHVGAVEPAEGSDLAGLAQQRIACFQFQHILAALEQAGVEAVRVRFRIHQEIAAAQRPLFLVELGGDAVAQSELVGGVVKSARRP